MCVFWAMQFPIHFYFFHSIFLFFFKDFFLAHTPGTQVNRFRLWVGSYADKEEHSESQWHHWQWDPERYHGQSEPGSHWRNRSVSIIFTGILDSFYPIEKETVFKFFFFLAGSLTKLLTNQSLSTLMLYLTISDCFFNSLKTARWQTLQLHQKLSCV